MVLIIIIIAGIALMGMSLSLGLSLGNSRLAGPPSLGTLVLSGTIYNGTTSGGNILGAFTGSTIVSNVTGLTVNSGARTYVWDGTGTAGTTSNGLVETKAGIANSPRSTAITVQSAAVTLGTLLLSNTIVNGTSSSGTITGASTGSTIVSNVSGLTVNSGARTYSWDGTGAAATTSNGLVETLALAIGSPKSNPITVQAAGVTLPANNVPGPTNLGTVNNNRVSLDAGAASHYIEFTLGSGGDYWVLGAAGDAAGANWIGVAAANVRHNTAQKRIAGTETQWSPWTYNDYGRDLIAGDVIRLTYNANSGELNTTLNGADIASGRRFSSDVATVGAPFGNYVHVEALYGANLGNVTYGPISTPLAVNNAAYDRAANTLTLTIGYTSATAPTYEISMNGGAYRDIPAIANPSTGIGTLRLSGADTGVSDLVNFTLRQKGTSTTAASTFIVPEKMMPGINIGGEGSNDLGQDIGWVSGADYSNGGLGRIGDYIPTGRGYIGSTDGAGSTVKRGPNGGFYSSPNNLGLTEFRGRIERVFTASQVGAWTFTFPAGTSVGSGNTTTGTSWAYNSATGIGSFSIPDSTNTYVIEFTIVVSTIPSGVECMPVVNKNGVTAEFNQNTIDAIAAVADLVRPLDVSATNNANYNNRTPLALPTRSFTNRNRYGLWDVEKQVRFANALRTTGNSQGNLWYLTMHIDDDTMIDGAADYIAANLNGNAFYSFSNEISFNSIFQQNSDAFTAGVRAGMAPAGATPGTLVPETIYEAHVSGRVQSPTIERGDWDGTTFTVRDEATGDYIRQIVSLPAGGKIIVGHAGQTVYQTTGAAPAGSVWCPSGPWSSGFQYNVGYTAYVGSQLYKCILYPPVGTAVTNTTYWTPISSGNVALFSPIYTSADSTRAQYRWISSRVKNMITRVTARYTAAGKAAPKFILDAFALGESIAETMLNWDNLYLSMAGSYVCPGPYYGNGAFGANAPANLGEYNDSGYSEWSPTTGKLALFDATTNVTLASRIAAASTAYFSASGKVVTATVNGMQGFNNSLRAGNVGRGQASGAIKQGAYEFNWHVQFANWPDKSAAAYNSGTTYAIGSFVTSGGNMYRAYAVPPVGTAPTNTTYWQVVATAAELVNGAPSDQLFTAIVNDSRHGTDILNHTQGLRNIYGGPSCFYVSFGRNISSSNYFGLMTGESDTGAGNYRRTAYKTVVDQVRAS